ncbi:MAG: dTMP kinase [Victivallales bacterium]|nr:dTMP kinase [Victivallales bacterium]MCF7889184.1 dTMP kinase [Victivallales bacterium]
MSKNKGYFITFEGPDGSGKSTHIKLVYEALTALNLSCILTREPGGTELGERIRNILKDTALNKTLSIQTEALLLQTARAQHIHEIINPALKEGKIVLCDRFADSSTAYQGIAHGLGKEIIEYLNKISTSGLKPDITIVLDIAPEEGLKRAEKRSRNEPKDRWEEQKSDFHYKVRYAFLELAKAEPERFRVVPVRGTVAETQKQIYNIVKNALGLL